MVLQRPGRTLSGSTSTRFQTHPASSQLSARPATFRGGLPFSLWEHPHQLATPRQTERRMYSPTPGWQQCYLPGTFGLGTGLRNRHLYTESRYTCPSTHCPLSLSLIRTTACLQEAFIPIDTLSSIPACFSSSPFPVSFPPANRPSACWHDGNLSGSSENACRILYRNVNDY